MNFSREGDIVARYGGEEFAVILPNVGRETAVMLAEKMRANVEALKLEHNSSKVADVVTISAGIAVQIPSRKMNAANLIMLADKALYRAKEKGRNRVMYSD